ncbi:MAG: hypothetical protein WAP37_04800, partial [Solirubrobacterales bacterium]
MRKFSSLSWRNLRSRPLRATLNGLGIVLGVGLIFAVVSLSSNLVSTFEDLFDTVYGKTDLIVSTENSAGIIPDSTLEKVRSIEGVAGASGIIQTISSIVKNGRA